MSLMGSRKLQGKWLRWAVAAASCQGFLLLGYDQGVMSGIIGANNQFGKEFGNPNADMQGIIVSIYDIGCAFGSLIALTAGHIIGRKRLILMGGSIMVVGTAILASSTTIAQLLVGRIVTGIGNGFNSSIIPTYQSEFARPENRGRLLAAQGTVTIIGLCIAYWLDFGMSYVDGPSQWRFPIAFQGFFAVCLVLQMLPLPDTPRFLIEKDRVNDGAEILARLQGPGTNINDPRVLHLRTQIETSIKMESAGGPFQWKELLKGGKIQNFRRILICMGIMVMQQFTGSNFINYYAPVIYQTTMNLSRTMSLVMGGCTSLAYLVGSALPLLFIDRLGRRASLLASSAGLCFCFSIVSILLSVGTRSSAWGATAFIFVFQIFMGVGWLPVPWLYPAEISPTRIRARGQALASFINWMCVFTVVQITPIAVQNISWRCFIIFAVFCAAWMPIVYCFFPETNQLELEDIDHLFERGGVTGGVWGARAGRTVERHAHERQVGLDEEVKDIREVGKSEVV